MRLQPRLLPMSPPPPDGLYVWDSSCGRMTPAREAVADLDGPAGTFYCPTCAAVKRSAAIRTAADAERKSP